VRVRVRTPCAGAPVLRFLAYADVSQQGSTLADWRRLARYSPRVSRGACARGCNVGCGAGIAQTICAGMCVVVSALESARGCKGRALCLPLVHTLSPHLTAPRAYTLPQPCLVCVETYLRCVLTAASAAAAAAHGQRDTADAGRVSSRSRA
jgi:hypothetical protein